MYVNVIMEHFVELDGEMVPDTDREVQKETFEKVFLAKVSGWVLTLTFAFHLLFIGGRGERG